jgi:hypothetical protein
MNKPQGTNEYKKIYGDKARLAGKADNLTVIYEPKATKCEALEV